MAASSTKVPETVDGSKPDRLAVAQQLMRGVLPSVRDKELELIRLYHLEHTVSGDFTQWPGPAVETCNNDLYASSCPCQSAEQLCGRQI